MFTQPPAAAPVEMTVDIDGMGFERTDIPNGVDDSGLLVARTLLTRSQAAHAAQRLQALRKSDRPFTHGQIAMQAQSGDADVTGWGHEGNAIETLRYPLRLVGWPLSWGVDKNSTVSAGFTGELFPSALLAVQPGFKHHPAAVSWLTSVALAAAKTEANTQWIVRLMSKDEYRALLKYVYGEMSEDQIKAMSVLEKRETASVVGLEADKRKRRGITDAFGHVRNWVSNVHDLEALRGDDVRLLKLKRVLCGASRMDSLTSTTDCDGAYPDNRQRGFYAQYGVRFVAVPARKINDG